jgi:hypothetical protein
MKKRIELAILIFLLRLALKVGQKLGCAVGRRLPRDLNAQGKDKRTGAKLEIPSSTAKQLSSELAVDECIGLDGKTRRMPIWQECLICLGHRQSLVDKRKGHSNGY